VIAVSAPAFAAAAAPAQHPDPRNVTRALVVRSNWSDREFKSSMEQFEAMKAAAKGGTKMTYDKLPNWTGLWTRKASRLGFDDPAGPNPRLPQYSAVPVPLTPEYQPIFDKFLDDVARGIEWDQLSECLPSGYPRMLTTPFLREWVLRPEQTWMILEELSEARRIYTDGRGHIPDDEAYPLWDGDTIGFWDGDVLVSHTKHIKGYRYTRGQPEYSDQTTTVERTRKIQPDIIQTEVWVYDPVVLAKPWHTFFHYERITDPPNLRINMWSCAENNNVVKDATGTTNFVLPGEPGYKDPNTLVRRLGRGAGRSLPVRQASGPYESAAGGPAPPPPRKGGAKRGHPAQKCICRGRSVRRVISHSIFWLEISAAALEYLWRF
jgi:hypothetical protein